MTISTDIAASGPFFPNGVTTAFPFEVDVTDAADLTVAWVYANGSEEVISASSYTVMISPTEAGGTVLFSAAPSLPADDAQLWIALDPDFDQQDRYTDEGPFNQSLLERSLDGLARLSIFLKDRLTRSVQVPRGEVGLSLPTVAARALGVLRFDNDGNPVALPVNELGVLLSPGAQAGVTEIFTLSQGPRSQVVVFDPDGVDEGGYFVQFSPAVEVEFTRAYARVFGGSGTVDVRVLGGGVLWEALGVGGVATDEVVDITMTIGFDLIVVLENVVGDVSGVVVFLEGSAV